MRMLLVAAGLSVALIPLSTSTMAAEPKPTRSERMTQLVLCRSIAVEAQRLACFDREVAALDAAESRQDVVIVDRAQITKTRRTLFGLTLPNLSVFGDDHPDSEGMARIEGTLKSARQNPYGKWILELDDGAKWIQIDSREIALDPRPGQPIKIRRAGLGSYMANVNGQTGIRVRRVT